ncbi:MAG: OmpA family protein [Flavobacteriaceae bacterium]
MKPLNNTFRISIALLILLIGTLVKAQEGEKNNGSFSVSPRVGYDLPTYNNDTPYIDYEGGLDLGISVDYYWSWFGFGADFDYIKNAPKSIYATDNLIPYGDIDPLTNFALSEENITRTFYGVGPNVQYRSTTGKFTAELNTRVGLSSINGGRTELAHIESGSVLNFHSGYDATNIISGKGQLRFTYFFAKNLGLNLGGYFLGHLGVEDRVEAGRSATYFPYVLGEDLRKNPANILDRNGPSVRNEGYTHDIFSVGAFVGVTYKTNKKENKCEVCGLDHKPHCTLAAGCDVTVIARDKYSREVLANTDVIIENVGGKLIQTGKTNVYGAVIFTDLVPDNYVIKGKLNERNLDETILEKGAFEECVKNHTAIEKEIVYSDQSFIMTGNVIECNSTTAIQGVDVLLKDVNSASRKNSRSSSSGDFLFYLNQKSIYTLKGNKDGYFSNEVEVDTRIYDRNKSLFIDLQMCVDPCGKAIRLQNINFDLAKWNILPVSRTELDYIVKLMQDNPDIKVEMSSHTDARGGNDYNLDLSQKRAQSTVDYLAAQGIERNRLIARGAGESELLNACFDGLECSEADHALNRRTEFKVVCAQ